MKTSAFASALALTLAFGALSAAPAFAQSAVTMTSAQSMPATSLSIGSTGSGVVWLQAFLSENGDLMIPAGTAMGYFGSLTQQALMKYQASAGIPATGMYDPATMARISGGSSMTSTSASGTPGMTTAGSMTAPSTMTKAAALRATMNDLLVEHVTSSLSVLRAIEDGNTAAEQGALQEQDANAVDLAAAIGSVYGSSAQTAFLQMFRDHITASNAYTQGLKANNVVNQQSALASLDAQLVKIAGFLSGANPNIDDATLLAALRQHEVLVNDSSQAYSQGNYAQAFNYERQAIKQIAGGADYLSNAIVEQYPNMFMN